MLDAVIIGLWVVGITVVMTTLMWGLHMLHLYLTRKRS